jgi:acyl-CoA thioester hydrolase
MRDELAVAGDDQIEIASAAHLRHPLAPMPPILESRLSVTLRWRDMDMLGHLNQSVYHELLEEGRAALMIKLAGQAGSVDHNTYVVVRVELDYKHEVRKDHGHVDIVVRTAGVGTSSFTLEHDVLLPDGTVAATGKTILVGWDALARGKRALSEAERSALAP